MLLSSSQPALYSKYKIIIIWVYEPLRSVDTPVENNPLEATAKEPPKSTSHRCQQVCYGWFGVCCMFYVPIEAIVPP